MPHPQAPATRHLGWTDQLSTTEIGDHISAVYQAISGAHEFVGEALSKATGEELRNVYAGVFGSLLMIVGVVAAAATLGAVAGAAVGSLMLGVGAAPGAVVGAGVGLDASLAILDLLGLGFLAVYIGKSLVTGASMAGDAIAMAWNSVEHPKTRLTVIRDASRMLARAVSEVFRGVLQGVVAFLVAKGVSAAASRVPELTAKLRASKLGQPFAEWIQRNWTRLLEHDGFDAPSQPGETEMIWMLTHKGSVERGQLLRRLKGKYVIRGEAMGAKGPGDSFNGPFSSLAEAKAAAASLASSETALRHGNAVVRVWPGGKQSVCEVVRVYKVEYDAPGILSVAASQPESGTVMARPAHWEAIRRGRPEIAHEYGGGNNQVELPVSGVREAYGIHIVTRVQGVEYPVKPDGTGF